MVWPLSTEVPVGGKINTKIALRSIFEIFGGLKEERPKFSQISWYFFFKLSNKICFFSIIPHPEKELLFA